MSDPKKEICSIRVIFPVMSDEQAIDCKKKIAASVVDIPEAQIHFSLMPIPVPNAASPQIR